MNVLFFIESLHSGGKERRLVELLTYLKNKPDYELLMVLMQPDIHYNKFLEMKIPYVVLERKWLRKDPLMFIKFYNICKKYHPDIIHTWGNMVSFYSLPAAVLLRIPLVNNQITSAPHRIHKYSKLYVMSKISFGFSKMILANSLAGLKSFKIKNKNNKVIYNGMNLERLKNLPDRETVIAKYGINTPYSVIMVASFSSRKDYNKFINVARETNFIRKDVTFVAVGCGVQLERIKKKVWKDKISNVLFTGRVDDVEAIVSIADIGILFSLFGEGISNAIMEYMALGKPVIANDSGGTKEIVMHETNGYLLTNESPRVIAGLINDLLNDREKRARMGEAGRKLIYESFTLDRMGKEFEKVYQVAIGK